jgi:23S rRNA (uracil1939-C5)-methyltransferase
LHPELLAALPRLRSLASAFGGGAFDLSATLCANGLDVNVLGRGLAEPAGGKLADIANAARVCRLSMNGDPLITLVPPRIAFEGISAVPPPGAFLQASAEGEAALLALVRKAIGGARRIADLFCGLGAFALPLSIGARVDAFDSDLPAIHALNEAVKDAQRNGLTLRAGGETRNLFERPLSASEIGKFDAVVFDPPRAGAEAQAAELAKSKIACVIGVSCNPDSFARDAAILSLGGFELVETTPVDQFVYAPHIELVGVFRRR